MQNSTNIREGNSHVPNKPLSSLPSLSEKPKKRRRKEAQRKGGTVYKPSIPGYLFSSPLLPPPPPQHHRC